VTKYDLLMGKKVDLFWPPGLPGNSGAEAGADRIGARREALPGAGMVPLTGRTKLGRLPSRHRAGPEMSAPPRPSLGGFPGARAKIMWPGSYAVPLIQTTSCATGNCARRSWFRNIDLAFRNPEARVLSLNRNSAFLSTFLNVPLKATR
jgi:hypothetical protein